jgi:hypothetical protein
MRRLPGRRLVMLLAILLVAASLSTRGVGASECDCCGPMMAAPAAPVPPCCVGTVDRRMAASTSSQTIPAPTQSLKAVAASHYEPFLPSPRRGHPPGELRPVYLSISVLRI